MTRIEQCLVVAGVVGCSLLAYALREVSSPDGSKSSGTEARLSSLPQDTPATPRKPEAGQARGEVRATPRTSSEAEEILALVKGSEPVPEQALVRLSGMVNIANSLNAPPDKDAWRDALPVARRLMKGSCDCGQQNWLSHFVEMGNYALSNSEREYRESAQLMQALGRNNAQEADTLARIH